MTVRIGRPRNEDARRRVIAVITEHPDMPHRHVALAAGATEHMVRAVRRERGEIAVPTPIGASLLRSLEPRHVAALDRLARAVASGSDMRVRAVLSTPEMRQLMDAAREAE